jgi:hypothetical protein
MQKVILIFLLIFSLLLNNNGWSNEVQKENGWCIATSPNQDWESKIQRIIQHQKLTNSNDERTTASYVIPVIVHVCYYQNTNSQNIPASRVTAQITTLNNDFAGIGLNSDIVPAPFVPVKGNANITFQLAKLDLNNNILAEPGIDRVNAQSKGWPNPGTQGWERDFIDGTIKKSIIWDPNYYLNIWVVPAIKSSSGGTILGYATFPGMSTLDGMPDFPGNLQNDGLVIRASYFGTTGSSKGRTATHEIGHWLGLRHIWGDESCGTDFVNDTPTAQTSNGGCPTYPYKVNACGAGSSPNGEMFMNFMDYTTDNCMSMFTNDQVSRFQAVMENADFRVNLPNSPVLDTVKQKPVAKLSILKLNAALCATVQTIDFTDKSLFAPTSWKWSFSGGTPSTSTLKNPANISFNTGGLHDVQLIAFNAVGSDTLNYQLNVPIVGTATFPFTEDFESPYFPPIGWETVNRNGNPAINWDARVGYSGFGNGIRSMIFDNTSLDGKYSKDDIQTPKIDLTGISAAKLKFDVAYAPFFGDIGSGVDEFLWDTLEVLITDNCQLTTQSIYKKGEPNLATFPEGIGSEFYPTSSQWRSDTVIIPAAYLNKPNVQLIFRNYGDYGHTIYVDNINLFSTVSTPSATASFTASDTTVCVGGSLTFTSTSVATNGGTLDSIRWTLNGGTPNTGTTTSITPLFNTAGTYTISLIAYTHDGPTVIASTVATKSIRVKSLPSVTVNSATICSGSTATLTASGATTYSWNPNIGNLATVTTPPLNSTTNYTVTGTKDGCVNTAIATVTVNTKPDVNVNVASICAGETATLNATGADSYTWNPNIGNTASVTTPALSVTTNYTVIGMLSNGCKDTAVSVVTVKSLPTVTVNSPTICSGATATLTASGAVSYTWNPNIGTSATVSTPPLTATTNYTVTGIGSNGCPKTVTSTVTVTSTAPTVNITPNPASVCAGESITLTASGADNYTWTSSQTGTTTGASLVFTPSSNVMVNLSGTLTGCGTAGTTNVQVTVKPKPDVTVNSPAICSGTSATLNATGADSYTWNPNIGNTASVTTPTLTNTTNYTVIGTSDGCKDTAIATVTVNAKPTVSVNSASICEGETTDLTASGATSYTWTPNIGNTASVTTPALNSTTNYTVTGSDGTCENTAVATVTVKSKPSTPSITQNGGSDTIQSSTIVVGATYEWYKEGNLVATTNNPYYVIDTTGIYTVKVISLGCSSLVSNNFNAIFTAIRVKSNTINNFELYPNPTDGRLVFQLDMKKPSQVSVELYTLEGRAMYSKEYKTTQSIREELDMQEYAKGVYLIKLKVDEESFYHKVVKQ